MQRSSCRVDVLGNHVSFVNVTLDPLSNTGTLDSQTVLDTVSKSELGALGCRRQQLLHAILPRQLHQLRLSTLRVHGVVPFARHGVLVVSEWVCSFLLVGRLGLTLGDEGGGRPAGEESLERRRERLG